MTALYLLLTLSSAGRISIKQDAYSTIFSELNEIIKLIRLEELMAEHRGGSGNFAEDHEKASEAGKKGGQNSGGNFANDREKASEAGKKGGENSHKNR